MKAIQGRLGAAVLMGAAASLLVFAPGVKAQNRNFDDDQGANGSSASNDNVWPYKQAHRSPVLAVVGDVACQPGEEPSTEKAGENCAGDTAQNLIQSQAATAQQIENMKPDLVAIVRDEQYQVGNYSDFENSFDLTYGAFKFLHRPSPGNHEFYNEHGAIGVAGYGYFSYYNGFLHNAGQIAVQLLMNFAHSDAIVWEPPMRVGGAGALRCRAQPARDG